jgi:hypothetical protein
MTRKTADDVVLEKTAVAAPLAAGGSAPLTVIATTTLKNAMATYYGTQCTHASLHTADPGTTGASEVTGGTYARKPITWGSPSGGVVTGSVTFDVPAGTTVTYAGLSNALTAGTFQDKVAITSQVFSTAGTLTVNFSFTQS